jgi:hypothetical protein
MSRHVTFAKILFALFTSRPRIRPTWHHSTSNIALTQASFMRGSDDAADASRRGACNAESLPASTEFAAGDSDKLLREFSMKTVIAAAALAVGLMGVTTGAAEARWHHGWHSGWHHHRYCSSWGWRHHHTRYCRGWRW